MAALWPELKLLLEAGLVGIACTSYKPAVAPAGATKPLYGTNPISFAWPRPGKTPVVYDMATASMAMGEVQIAKREGHKVPLGTGLTKEGKETTDPGEIADGGVILPFGGYKRI
jgi:delta1-piperideine-2-carboxylate reductase